VSVSEAIRSLEALGLVEVYHGRGCLVSRGPGDRYVDTLASWLRVHKDEVFELLNVRGALDELAAQEAAQRKDAKALRRVRKARDAFAAAAEREDTPPDELVALDIAFHLAIAEASGSTLLRRLLEDLNTQLSESRKATFMPPGRPLHSAEEHAEIVDAIVAGDGEAARTAVAAHLRAVREVLENLARREPKVAE
jgi:DNA-binding FadR family transcriptional regulator